MDPKPDYGYDSYKGSGKLKGKVRVPMALRHYTTVLSRHALCKSTPCGRKRLLFDCNMCPMRAMMRHHAHMAVHRIHSLLNSTLPASMCALCIEAIMAQPAPLHESVELCLPRCCILPVHTCLEGISTPSLPSSLFSCPCRLRL